MQRPASGRLPATFGLFAQLSEGPLRDAFGAFAGDIRYESAYVVD